LINRINGKRTVLLGVGNPMRGDDGAGPALIDLLQGRVDAVLIDAGEVPENFLGSLQAAQPEAVVIIDAIEMGAGPGGVALLELEHLCSPTGPIHSPGLAVLGRLIRELTSADVFVLGVQPESSMPYESLSLPVSISLQNLGELFEALV
jgi:hydrogenase 3 maturation protease